MPRISTYVITIISLSISSFVVLLLCYNGVQAPSMSPSSSWRIRYQQSTANPPWLTRAEIRASVSSTHDPHLNDVAREYVQLNKDFTTKPNDIKFIPDYRNPCWMSNSSVKQGQVKSQCLPYFYLLGFSKCGTTDMWKSMTKHRQMAATMAKEPCWWTWRRIFLYKADREYPTLKDKMDMDFYLSHYNFSYVTRKEQIMGDWSTNGISGNNHLVRQLNSSYWEKQVSQDLVDAVRNYTLLAPHLIYQYTPKAKFIVSMRNPVERLFSAYLFGYVTQGFGKNTSSSDFHKRVVSKIAVYKACVNKAHTIRYCTYSPNVWGAGRLPYGPDLTLMKGLYVVFVADLLKVVPREQVLFIKFETYKKDRMPVLEDMANFLELDYDPDFAAKISANDDTEPTNSRKSHGMNEARMWKNTSDVLTDFYRPFNEHLAELLDDQQFLFDEPTFD